jgi:ABC-type histidine transport system ATPase subunit
LFVCRDGEDSFLHGQSEAKQKAATPPAKQKEQTDSTEPSGLNKTEQDTSMETEASLSEFLQDLHIGNLHKTKYYIEKRQLWRSRRYKIPSALAEKEEEVYVFGKPKDLDPDAVDEYYKAFRDLVNLGKTLAEKQKLSEAECRFFDSVSREVTTA